VGDDAFFTWTTIDNFINGYGLRFNLDERVQAYTHPLWMVVNVIPYLLIQDIFISSTILSVLLSMSAIYIISNKYKNNTLIILFVFISLTYSKTFVQFSACGLENPLSFFLLAIITQSFFKAENHNSVYLKFILLTSLLFLNRMDSILLLFPALTYLILKDRIDLNKIKLALIGFSPISFWFLFSLLYYGFLFPNTKYAKLNTGLDLNYYLSHGIKYLNNFIINDTFSFFSLIHVIIIGTTSLIIYLRRKNNDYLKIFLLTLGVICYSFYVIRIGGDFMFGRFWTLPFFVSIIILTKFYSNFSNKILAFTPLIFIPLFLLKAQTYWRTHPDKSFTIVNEQLFFWYTNSLYSRIMYGKSTSDFILSQIGSKQKEKKEKYVSFGRNPASHSYYCGINCITIDTHALSDPFLARMPTTSKDPRIGHFERHVPIGYFEFRKYGTTKIMHPEITKYLKALSIIIREPIFSLERIKVIIKFNLGYYDKYKKNYLAATMN
jgi:arabinofuranosyltransferase